MSDFVADETLTFKVNKGGYEMFFENIEKNTTIRGAFYLDYESEETIDFRIISPEGDNELVLAKRREGIFRLNVTIIG